MRSPRNAMCKIDTIAIHSTTTRELTASIDTKGDLVLAGREHIEAQDLGDAEGHFAGDMAYRRTVTADYKDTLLLWLIKESFDDDSAFEAWLEAKGLPAAFESIDAQ